MLDEHGQDIESEQMAELVADAGNKVRSISHIPMHENISNKVLISTLLKEHMLSHAADTGPPMIKHKIKYLSCM